MYPSPSFSQFGELHIFKPNSPLPPPLKKKNMTDKNFEKMNFEIVISI